MSQASKILSGIEATSSTIRRLALDWDATDMPRVHASAAAIESSLQPLRKALENGEIAAHLSPELRSAAQGLEKQAAALERLVDAAAAFLRSVPAGLSNNSDAYNFDGEIRSVAARPTESYAG